MENGGAENRVELPWNNDDRQYEEVRSLGSGAYGTVYLVRNRVTGEEFALKKIKVVLSEEGIPQSVIREISTLKQIERKAHPNIARLIDVTHGLFNENELYIHVIFEKCDWDLYDFLSRIPTDLPEAQIRGMARQLVSGVDFLHSHGILHRDLKPQNILVNQDTTLKIADFGLARSYSLQASFTTVVVTLWYRAPEVLLQCSYSFSVDVWSLGCILAELYTRRALFAGRTESEQLHIILRTMGLPPAEQWPADAIVGRSAFPVYPPVPLTDLQQRCSPEALQLIKGMLNFQPPDRPSCQQALLHPYFLTGQVLLPGGVAQA